TPRRYTRSTSRFCQERSASWPGRRGIGESGGGELALGMLPESVHRVSRPGPGQWRDQTMPKYLVSGRNPNGQMVTERVEAASADEAVKLLDQRQFTDIVLHTSDVEALVGQQMRDLSGRRAQKAMDRFLTPRDYVRIRDSSRYFGMVLFQIGKAYAH